MLAVCGLVHIFQILNVGSFFPMNFNQSMKFGSGVCGEYWQVVILFGTLKLLLKNVEDTDISGDDVFWCVFIGT